MGLCQQYTQLSEEWWNYISGPGKWRDEEMERQSGKEGESILFPSRAKGNSIRPIMEPFFTSFHISLLYNSSSCPFLPPLYSLKTVQRHLASAALLLPRKPFSFLWAPVSSFVPPVYGSLRKSYHNVASHWWKAKSHKMSTTFKSCVINPTEQLRHSLEATSSLTKEL